MPAADTSLPLSADDSAAVQLATQHWLETAVIGLNLCPFAKAVWAKQQVRIVVSGVDSPEALVEVLRAELRHLAETDAETTDTTLIVHPRVLQDFLDFNDFLGVADGVLVDEDLEGELQVASFHPQFQFEGTAPDDMGNFSNRSPYPTLHLLREDSIDRAVEAFPEAEAIYERNIETLEKLGPAGWQALFPPR
ncbi:DUF1415 domain-containing protein [Ideonella azotifigens]|uniref:DUF1415 domain-containing protein n=1 Tax=Ideonella azotifigens TaxID=513160 RepID=A0ABN1JHP8_9BURK|nr:DUF1415 domain-containing protein [Ideonella azotifigens]MCD2343585.1 DUF1415 domain-containing protein [Ideonella azotifigens]